MENKLLGISKQIIYEDNHLLVVNKLPGQLVQGDKTGDISLNDILKEYIKVMAQKPGNVFLGTVHRLDRPCSGVVVFAKTSKALERMNTIFREQQSLKTYMAVTESSPKEEKGILKNWLKKNESANKSFVVNEHVKGAKLAVLDYECIAQSKSYSLIKVHLHTGRHHQIRVQLSHIGCYIKGDMKYGAKRSNQNASIHLHAWKLKFIHPVSNNEVEYIALPPDDLLWNYFIKEEIFF
jgi:23S rRNA pseudouridine1911/1915/1917 synthase